MTPPSGAACSSPPDFPIGIQREEPMPLRYSRKHKQSWPPGRKAFRFRPFLEPLEQRTLLATINWIAGSGNFHDGSNWSGGLVPGANDVAVIDTGATAATITMQSADNIQVQA